MTERETLEIEVAAHTARVQQIGAALENLERDIGTAGDSSDRLAQQAALLRMELKGRNAAVAVGSARLRMLPPD